MKRLPTLLLPYAWIPLLILAAVLTPQWTAKLTLIVAAAVYFLLLTAQSRKFEPSALRAQRRLLTILVIAALAIFAAVLIFGDSLQVARLYTSLLLVALTPLGLEAELVVLSRTHHRPAETIRTAVDYATEDAYTLLAVIALSLIGTLWLQIPPALSVMQILIITCIARPLLSGRALQATLHKANHGWRITFTSVTVYLSFLFFFIRHYFSPAHLDTANPLTWRATAVAMATFIACQTALEFLNPQAPRHIGRKVILIAAVVVAIVYVPFTQNYFMTRNVSAVDWFCALVGGLFYMSLYLLQRQTATHSRRSVIELHKQR